MLPPLNDLLWGYFWRGLLAGIVVGFLLVLMIYFWDQRYRGGLLLVKPISLFYFIAGVEIGIALVAGLVAGGLQVLGLGKVQNSATSKS